MALYSLSPCNHPIALLSLFPHCRHSQCLSCTHEQLAIPTASHLSSVDSFPPLSFFHSFSSFSPLPLIQLMCNHAITIAHPSNNHHHIEPQSLSSSTSSPFPTISLFFSFPLFPLHDTPPSRIACAPLHYRCIFTLDFFPSSLAFSLLSCCLYTIISLSAHVPLEAITCCLLRYIQGTTALQTSLTLEIRIQ